MPECGSDNMIQTRMHLCKAHGVGWGGGVVIVVIVVKSITTFVDALNLEKYDVFFCC